MRWRLNILDSIFKMGFDFFKQWRICFFLFFINLINIKIPFFSTYELLFVIFRKGLDNKFINRIRHQKDFIIFFLERFKMWTIQYGGEVVTGDVVYIFLIRLHVVDIILKGNPLSVWLCGFKTGKIGNFFSILPIGVDSLFNDCPEFIIKFFILFRFHMVKRIDNFFNQIFSYVSDNGILLKNFSADIQV